MATIKAFIRTSTKEKKFVNVRFRLTDGRDVQLFHKSDIKVSPNDFDVKNEKIKAKIIFDAKSRKFIDDSITDRKKLISKLYLLAPDKSVLTSDWLEDAINRELYPNRYNLQEDTLLAHVANFISNAHNRKKKKTNETISPITIKSYVSNQNRLIAFAKYKGKEDFLFSEIDLQFYNDYVDFLTNRERTLKRVHGVEVNEVRQYAKNTVGDAIKALKTMISDVRGLDIKMKDLYVFTEDVDNVYLNETELQQLKDFDFSGVPHLDRVRDWFLLLAWTGSRFSDLQKIDLSNIKNNFITYRQQKTKTAVTIPVHPVVNEILNKYNYQMPKAITNQKFNDYIKEACKLAGIDTLESFTRTVGGKEVTETKPKFDLVSSHTCRRSFCTNMYKRGLNTLTIMSVSGHKTEKSFLKYIKVSQQEHAELMAEKWKDIYNNYSVDSVTE
ncbi:MAG: site-specific integrase [Paludibacter sp.]